jgi:hypothetical protein
MCVAAIFVQLFAISKFVDERRHGSDALVPNIGES